MIPYHPMQDIGLVLQTMRRKESGDGGIQMRR
jgi:hypothetical protein